MAEVNTKTARWVKVVLALSLLLNLLIVGLAGGAFVKGRELRDARPDAGGMSFVTRALPLQHQAEVRHEIRNRIDEMRANRDEIRVLRRDLAAALTAEPFDMGVVEDIFDRQRNILIGLAGAGHEIVIRQIETMDEDDRARYADNLLREHPPRDR